MSPQINCLVVVGSWLVMAVWFVLLVASMVFRPKPAATMRLLERLLIVASVLMFLASGATLLAIRAKMAEEPATGAPTVPPPFSRSKRTSASPPAPAHGDVARREFV